MRQQILLAAWVDKAGKEGVDIWVGTESRVFKARCQVANLAHDACFSDWQASIHDTVSEAKSALMRLYGIDWFNRFRRHFKSVEADCLRDVVWC